MNPLHKNFILKNERARSTQKEEIPGGTKLSFQFFAPKAKGVHTPPPKKLRCFYEKSVGGHVTGQTDDLDQEPNAFKIHCYRLPNRKYFHKPPCKRNNSGTGSMRNVSFFFPRGVTNNAEKAVDTNVTTKIVEDTKKVTTHSFSEHGDCTAVKDPFGLHNEKWMDGSDCSQLSTNCLQDSSQDNMHGHSQVGLDGVVEENGNFINHVKSDSQYGWFEDLAQPVEEDKPHISIMKLMSCKTSASETNDGSVIKQYDIEHQNISLKYFGMRYPGKIFAWTITSFRIIQEAAQTKYAQYEIVTLFGDELCFVWKRHSDFHELAALAHRNFFQSTKAAWMEIKTNAPWYQCLDESYLQMKAVLLSFFLQRLLFDCEDPSLLIEFLHGNIEENV